MSIIVCSECDRYVDTDVEETETKDGKEICEQCFVKIISENE